MISNVATVGAGWQVEGTKGVAAGCSNPVIQSNSMYIMNVPRNTYLQLALRVVYVG